MRTALVVCLLACLAGALASVARDTESASTAIDLGAAGGIIDALSDHPASAVIMRHVAFAVAALAAAGVLSREALVRCGAVPALVHALPRRAADAGCVVALLCALRPLAPSPDYATAAVAAGLPAALAAVLRAQAGTAAVVRAALGLARPLCGRRDAVDALREAGVAEVLTAAAVTLGAPDIAEGAAEVARAVEVGQ